MRLDLAQSGFAQVVPQMPPITDVRRTGQGPADGLGVGRGTVAAHRLDVRTLAQSSLQGADRAVGQHIVPIVGLGIDDHGGTAVFPAQREVIDAEHAGHPPCA
ncbi:hypothetical protein TUSST3_38010 [Streptomyces sp. TUS-ST3]|nr:hypothetical protein TUSST3_38010 [Streptomyces sp. TUS-ST3]